MRNINQQLSEKLREFDKELTENCANLVNMCKQNIDFEARLLDEYPKIKKTFEEWYKSDDTFGYTGYEPPRFMRFCDGLDKWDDQYHNMNGKMNKALESAESTFDSKCRNIMETLEKYANIEVTKKSYEISSSTPLRDFKACFNGCFQRKKQ